jgi:hypothetical protein
MFPTIHKIPFTLLLVIISCISGTSHSAILMQPYLQAVTQNSIYVMVECSTSDTVEVSYGVSSSLGSLAKTTLISTTTNIPSTFIHKIKLTGLLPNTLHYYKAAQGSSVSAIFTFTTAVNPGTPFRMAWMADCRTGTLIHDQISGLIATYDPKFSCYGGDYCSDASYTSWKNEFFRTSELNLISHVPFFAAIGNHETWGTNTKAFTRSPDSPSNTQDYYSFDYGDVHFLCLNNQVSDGPGSAQYNFAQSDLASTSKTWKIVFFHNPAYCSGGHGEDADMKAMSQNIFVPKDVDLVLAGHSHFYQHNYLDGIHHMVIGAAGAPLTVPTWAQYTISLLKESEFAIIDVDTATLKLRVFNNDNDLIDSIMLEKTPSMSGPLNGTRTIGSSQCDFVSITQAFEYLRTQGNGIDGPLLLELNSDYLCSHEKFPLTLTAITGNTSVNTITIRPASGAGELLISSADSNGTLNLNGIDNLIIDGRPGGTGDSHLTIENQNAIGSAVQFINDACGNSIRYCTIKGINTSTSGGIVFFNGTTLTAGNDNNALDHCILRDGSSAPVNLVYSRGTNGKENSSNTISNSQLFNFTNSAIYLSGTGNGGSWTISGNHFYSNMTVPSSTTITVIRFGSAASTGNLITGNFIGGQSPNCGGSCWPVNGSSTFYGIWVTSASVTRNKISNIGSTETGSAPFIYGIYNSGGNVATNEFSNNMIALDGGISANPTLFGYYDNVSAGGECSLFYNSINIFGTPSATSFTYAARFNSGSVHTIKNNIFTNLRSQGGSGSHFAIYCSSSSSFTSNYNNLFSLAGPLGFFNSVNRPTLSAWQSATGVDLNSVSCSPLFTSYSDLHIQWDENLNNKGTTIPAITTDFDGNTRGAPPDPGINEFSLTRTWTGSLSSNWNEPGNWSPIGVPVAIQDVVIPSDMLKQPVINDPGMNCHNLTINQGATMTINPGIYLTVNGDLTIAEGATMVNPGYIELKGNLIK